MFGCSDSILTRSGASTLTIYYNEYIILELDVRFFRVTLFVAERQIINVINEINKRFSVHSESRQPLGLVKRGDGERERELETT